jgi:hypothetical protein
VAIVRRTGSVGAVACLRSDQAGPVFAVAIAPDGSTLASAGHDGAIRFWSLNTRKELRTIPGHPGKVRSIAFSPDGKVLATASSEKTVRLWDASSGKQLRKLSGSLENVVSVAFSPDGKNLACGGGWGQGSILIWDLAKGDVLQTLPLGGKAKEAWSVLRAISYSPDGKRLAAADDNDMVSVCDVETGKEQLRYLGHEKGVFSVAFAPDGKALLTAGGDKTIRLWDASTGKKLREFKGHEDWVTTAIFSPNGRTIASASYDKSVRIWEVATGKEIRQFIGHDDRIRCAAFAPDGKTLATGGVDATVIVWDVADACASGDARIKVGPNVHVSKSRENIAHGEVIIAADPKDSARLLAGSVITGPPTKDHAAVVSVVAYRSWDAGRTWELALEKTEEFGDPALAFDPEGCAYFVALDRKGRLESVRSRDGGKTWEAPIKLADQIDRPFLMVDRTTGKFRGRLYCNCNLIGKDGARPIVYVSRDGGKTFDPPKSLAVKDGASHFVGTCVVLSDSTLVMPYPVVISPPNGRYSIRVRRSIKPPCRPTPRSPPLGSSARRNTWRPFIERMGGFTARTACDSR